MELLNAPMSSALDALASGQTTAEALVNATFDRISALNPRLNAFLALDRERASARARACDEARASGEALPPLAGIPIAVKDLIATSFLPTTAASKMLEGYRPSYTATAVERLEAAGAIVIGKTNCDEFGLGASGEYSAFGPTRNPWDTERVAGGSSSGSAAAVSAGLAFAALGTDTGGSVRVPAAFTNLVGLKPTYGRVSRFGLIASTSSSDTIGVVTRTVRDAAAVFGAYAGHDPKDATSVAQPLPDYLARLEDDRRFRIGVPKEYFQSGMDPEVEAAVERAISRFSGLDAELVEVSLPHTEAALATYYLINPSEVSSNLARYDGIRYGLSPLRGGEKVALDEVYARARDKGFGPEAKRRILLGTFALSRGYADRYYLKAQRVRTLLKRDFENAFGLVDVLLTPTAPIVPFPVGSIQDPLSVYLIDVNMSAASLAGIPALSVPAGFVRGLPVGIQLIGPAFAEAELFALAARFEAATDWTKERPKL